MRKQDKQNPFEVPEEFMGTTPTDGTPGGGCVPEVPETETVSASVPKKMEYVINQWGEYFWKEI